MNDDTFNPLVSFYRNGYENLPDDLPAAQIVEAIRRSAYRQPIENIRKRFNKALDRSKGDRDAAKRVVDSDKKRLAAVSFSGTFATRANKLLIRHSGLLQADIDGIGAELARELREQMRADEHIFAAFLSPTADGLKALVRVPACANDAQHKIAHAAVAEYAKRKYNVAIDATGDVSRLCYVSDDDGAHLNRNAKPLPVQLPPVDRCEPAAAGVRQTLESSNSDSAKHQHVGFSKKLPNPTPDEPKTANSNPPNLELRRRIVGEMFTVLADGDDNKVFVECPNKAAHTSGDGAKDCYVWLVGGTSNAPSLCCSHNHCKGGALDAINFNLRSAVGKAENRGGNLILTRTGQMATVAISAVSATVDTSTPAATVEQRKAHIREILAARRFNFAVIPPPVVPVYSVKGTPICTPGNLTAITAQVKSGKSSWLAAMMASAMTSDPQADCFGITSANPDGKALIHFDTEQAPQDWDSLLRQACRRARIEQPPPWLVSYCITGLSVADVALAVAVGLADAAAEFGGVHSAMIDGVGDLVASVNDEEQSLALVSSLHGDAINHSCPVIGALHFNPNSDKSRGHLGSQLERKAETNLRLDKDENEVITAYSLKARKAPIAKTDGPRFKWDDVAGMHVSTGTIADAKDEARRAELEVMADAIFGERQSMRHSEMMAKLTVKTGLAVSEKTAERRIAELSRLKIIARSVAGLYSRA